MSRISSLGITLEGDTVSIGQKPDSPGAAGYSSYSETVTGSQASTAEKTIPEEEPESFDLNFKEALQKAASQKGKKFNIVLFIILFITPLWPIALIYAISFAVKQQKAALENTKK